jgi:hypothetical protein
MRGRDLNWRLAVKGIQKCEVSMFGMGFPFSRNSCFDGNYGCAGRASCC